MISKFKMICVISILGITNNVWAKVPPSIPDLYSKGPVSVLLSDTKLSAIEKTIYALYEATMSASKELIHATSCAAAAGKYTFNVTANGAIADPKNNEIKVVSPEKTNEPFILRANIDARTELRGQQISIEQFGPKSLGNAEISKFESTVLFNIESSIMTAENSAEVRGINGVNDRFQSQIIKDFYLDADANANFVYSWGLHSLSKLDFPIEIYWARSKLNRIDNVVESAILVDDRIIGASPCRILIESARPKDEKTVSQVGTLIISTEAPNQSHPDFNLKPNS